MNVLRFFKDLAINPILFFDPDHFIQFTRLLIDNFKELLLFVFTNILEIEEPIHPIILDPLNNDIQIILIKIFEIFIVPGYHL